jgi:hypothetical protein
MGTESLSDRGLTMYEGLMNWEDAVKAMTFLKDWAPPNGVSVRYEIRESTIHGFWLLALYLNPLCLTQKVGWAFRSKGCQMKPPWGS